MQKTENTQININMQRTFDMIAMWTIVDGGPHPPLSLTTRDCRRVGRGGTVGPGVREEAGGDFFITFCEK